LRCSTALFLPLCFSGGLEGKGGVLACAETHRRRMPCSVCVWTCCGPLARTPACSTTNEGIHHINTTSTRSAFRSSVSHMCHLLYTLSLQTGALALVREISAQNFATPTAPPGYEGEFEFVSSDHACISPSPARKNWHNEVLWDEATSWNLSTVPFYESTLFWGSVLFKKRTQNGLDCTHEICYTPAYYGPLCSAVTQLVLENASLITFSTFRRRRRSKKPDPVVRHDDSECRGLVDGASGRPNDVHDCSAARAPAAVAA